MCSSDLDSVRFLQGGEVIHIAALNPNVRAEAYDLNHFPALKETYNVMSVPCLVLNSEKVLFGKKSISQLLDTLEQQE